MPGSQNKLFSKEFVYFNPLNIDLVGVLIHNEVEPSTKFLSVHVNLHLDVMLRFRFLEPVLFHELKQPVVGSLGFSR